MLRRLVIVAAATLVLPAVAFAKGPVEATIALSILLLATEIARLSRGHPSLTTRFPWAVAFSFGLLHGLGFAGALSEIGLPQGDVPLALFSFNVGVELGQLSFVAAILAAYFLVTRLTFPKRLTQRAHFNHHQALLVAKAKFHRQIYGFAIHAEVGDFVPGPSFRE